MRKIMTLVAFVVLAGSVMAQTVPPALFVKDGEKKVEPLKLAKVETSVRIFGMLAETKTTMTFFNPHNRVLSGDLYFPLPEGSTVSGYALDVNGKMVDGSVVEKTKGRVTFEKIVRQGIDPGLIEWVKGNNFKTRVFPIPPKGTRTIRVEYVTELVTGSAGPAYHLPLKYNAKVGEFSLRVEVVKAAAKPKVTKGTLANFAFEQWRESFLAETKLTDVKLTEDLVIALPRVETKPVLVEKGTEGLYYFAIHDVVPTDPRKDARRKAPRRPNHITVLWDASASRAGKDRQKEIDLLAAYIKGTGMLVVDLFVFRNEVEKLRRFKLKGGDAGPLVEALGKIVYDGGTQIGALSRLYDNLGPDAYFLFTDGLSNFGKEEPRPFGAPLYVFSADATANHPFLRYLAMKNGGRYFNLKRIEAAAVVSAIGRTAFSFMATAVEGGEVADVYPARPVPAGKRFTLVGRLKGKQATVTLHYGVGGRILAKKTYTVSRADAARGRLLTRYWAQRKVDELMLFPKRNEKEIVATGKRYKLVTPYTSLIVLESLAQYVEHQIAPPDSLPKMQKQYEDQVAKILAARRKKEDDKLKTVLAMWENRVKWYETKFKYPKDFKYKGSKDKGGRESVMGLSQTDAVEADGESGDIPAGRPSPATPPPARPGDPQARAAADDDDDEGGRPAERSGEVDATVQYDVRDLLLPARRPQSKKETGLDGYVRRGMTIAIKPWDPKTPYLAELKRAKAEKAYKVYLELRKEYGASPAFFLDCGEFFLKARQVRIALRVLSNIAELELENAALVRVLAYKLSQIGKLELARLLFEEALRLRPEEPQSFRDLALVLAKQGKYDRAIELLYKVIMGKWDRFAEIELIALAELNAMLPKAKAAGVDVAKLGIDKRLIKLLDVDVRIILTWDADLTDMDLWVIEPSGEKAFYGHRRTTIGGNFSRDFTQGYGPEEYMVRHAMPGKYAIKVNYYGSSAAKLIGSVTLQVDIFTNYGRPDQKRQSITIRLTQNKETITVGEIKF